jgi:c-di-GMP-binding flagellar brake protein YcgR
MGNKWKKDRIHCEAKCILHFDAFEFQGIIKNISLSGALIMLNDTIPHTIHPGDKCDLMFCSNPDLYPVKYTSQVIRVESALIGVQFLELNIM